MLLIAYLLCGTGAIIILLAVVRVVVSGSSISMDEDERHG